MTTTISRTRTVRGVTVPSFLYGTAWKEARTAELVTQALSVGFRGVDTANQRRHYVEALVGDALAAAVEARSVERDELFVQTKFTYARGQDHRLPYDRNADVGAQVAQSFESSLEHLKVSVIDAYLLHGPAGATGMADADWQVWAAFEKLHDAAKVRLLGISNVNLGQLTALVAQARVKPAFVQNRCYARTGWDRDVRAFCRAHDIVYQGFSLLTANRSELETSPVTRLSERLGRTREQIVFRFALEVGMMPLTGSSSRQHLREDLECFDFELDDRALGTLEHLDA